MSNEIKTYFEKYLSIGLKPILLHPTSKKPLLSKWNSKYDQNKWKMLLQEHDNLNIGILLGDIIDVEADTEESNELLYSLIGNYKHPCFESSRSIHHIFLNPDVTLTATKFRGIEFRGNNVQSVFPPSIHVNGSRYRFLKESTFPIPPMPEELLKFYWENRKNQRKSEVKTRKKPKVKTLRENFKKSLCHNCKNYFIIHKKRLQLEVQAFLSMNKVWSCRKCREININSNCRNIRNQNKSR
jgi:hypothetical protein